MAGSLHTKGARKQLIGTSPFSTFVQTRFDQIRVDLKRIEAWKNIQQETDLQSVFSIEMWSVSNGMKMNQLDKFMQEWQEFLAVFGDKEKHHASGVFSLFAAKCSGVLPWVLFPEQSRHIPHPCWQLLCFNRREKRQIILWFVLSYSNMALSEQIGFFCRSNK